MEEKENEKTIVSCFHPNLCGPSMASFWRFRRLCYGVYFYWLFPHSRSAIILGFSPNKNPLLYHGLINLLQETIGFCGGNSP